MHRPKPLKIAAFFTTVILFQLLIFSCKKNPMVPTPPPNNPHDTTNIHDTIPLSVEPDLTVTNTWQCEIDGVLYSGTIDTSFTKITNPGFQFYDTAIFCTGTTLNKKATIHFVVNVNSKREPAEIYTRQFGETFLRFDTSSALAFSSYYTYTDATFTMDSMTSKKVKGRFSGELQAPGPSYSRIKITNGIFSCAFGKGNQEPEFFAFNFNKDSVAGYVNYARMVSNTLIIDGFPYAYDGGQTFRLLIHTGGTIKPGVYNSSEGDAGLLHYIPSIYKYFIDDSTNGNLSININSVDGDIISGIISSTYSLNGWFSCRVKDYVPQVDSVNKWRFSVSNGFSDFQIFGGNMLSAVQTQNGSQYQLRMTGESDNGSSAFLIRLSSGSPITNAIYQGGPGSGNSLDSMYFAPLWNGGMIYYHSFSDPETFCKILSIDNHLITGTLYGRFELGPDIRGGRFKVSF